MSEKFHAELEKLKEEVTAMARLADAMLEQAMDALVEQDDNRAMEVVSRKTEIRETGDRLEERAYQLIALYQPMAKDMRRIACALKIISSADRIGRYGKDIAGIVDEISDKPHIANLIGIPHMASLVEDMVRDAVSAYETEDLSLIEDFSRRDDTIDALRYSIFREAATYMIEDAKNISRCIHYIMVSRYLERCGDHACKIAENVHYMVTGERIEIN
jgi:phosphate transport system protein